MTEDLNCFHCGQETPSNQTFSCDLGGSTLFFCCPGCQFAAEFIYESGLQDFYSNREESSQPIDSLAFLSDDELAVIDTDEAEKDFLVAPHLDQKATFLSITGVRCAACCWLIERKLNSVPGVSQFSMNSVSNLAEVHWDSGVTKLSDIVLTLQKLGYGAGPISMSSGSKQLQDESKQTLKRLGVSGLGAMQVMMLGVGLYAGDFHGIALEYKSLMQWASLVMASVVVFYASRPFFYSAWRNLKQRHLNMDVPIASAIGLAYGASVLATVSGQGQVYFDSVCMFTFFITLGRYLELLARKKAADISYSLIDHLPNTARLIEMDEVGVILGEKRVAAKSLKVGDRILIKAGEQVPTDAVVLEGKSTVSEALLSGEALPQPKGAKDLLLGGSQNVEQNLLAEVCKGFDNSYLSTVLKLSERAQQQRPRLQGLSESVAQYFIAVLMVATVLVGLFWYEHEPERAMEIVLSLLVASCPCALSLAVPAAFSAATSALTRAGVLINSALVLESLPKVSDIIFDKTGTLTEGDFTIVGVQLLGAASEQQCLAIARLLERNASHPIASAFTKPATPGGSERVELQLSAFKQYPGAGVEGEVFGDSSEGRYRLGSLDFVDADLDGEAHDEAFCQQKRANQQVIYLASEHQLLCGFVLQDRLRKEAEGALQALSKDGYALRVYTGDPSEYSYKQVEDLPFREVEINLKPQDKLNRLNALRGQAANILMVGDGINDTPVLSGADVSLTLACGADLTKVNSDVILLDSNLDHVPLLMTMAKKTRRIVRQNYAWALAYNGSMLPLAAMGYIAPYVAAIGMSLSSIVVVMNALRLRRVV